MKISMKEIIISLFMCCLLSVFLYFFIQSFSGGVVSTSTPMESPISESSTTHKNSYYRPLINPPNILQEKPQSQLYKVVTIYPRANPTVYTQGLFYFNETIYESGGQYGKSTLTRMEWPSQKIIQQIQLDTKYFGEGISASISKNVLFQLTWREKEVLMYSFPELKFLGTIKMPTQLKEGWGMCNGPKENQFYATDGSSKIYLLELVDNSKNRDNSNNKSDNINYELKVISSIGVSFNYRSIGYLNDLTYDGTYIYCNIYLDSYIIKINPYNGNIMNYYEMTPLIDYEIKRGGLTKSRVSSGDVLNGITYIPERKSFVVTGKLWDFYYEVVFDQK